MRATNGSATHDATGTWTVENKTLVMKNKTSTTPLTVVGEEESATIVSLTNDEVVLENVTRKGKSERIAFHRVAPFVAGQTDNSAIVGTWISVPYNQLTEFTSGGDVIFNGDPSRKGKWSLTGGVLRMQIDPAPSASDVKSAARRAAQRNQLPQMIEQFLEVRFGADQGTMTLKPQDAKGDPVRSYRRATDAEKQRAASSARQQQQPNRGPRK
jgi:hypothetical protein